MAAPLQSLPRHAAEGLPLALPALARLAARMPEQTRMGFEGRLKHLYGDLGGQRAVDPAELARSVGLPEASSPWPPIVAVQTYCVLIAQLVAVASLEPRPAAWLAEAGRRPAARLRRMLRELSSGRALAERGVLGAADALPFDWYVEVATAGELEPLRALMDALGRGWTGSASSASGESPLDSLGALQTRLLPRNLRHLLGGTYTPGWLAQLLLEDSGWTPGRRLLDPFGGSGVFLLAALRRARELGTPAERALPDLCMIDLDPVACALARCNLAVALARQRREGDVCLPVLCADALVPALVRDPPDGAAAHDALARQGLRLARWLPAERADVPSASCVAPAVDGRRSAEQDAALALVPADVLATNPPWVGWEYIARPYRDRLEPAWRTYGLYTAKGRQASFLKEDLSTLALTTAWDRYLCDGGTSVAVLRASTMTSTTAAHGLRRLSVFPEGDPVALQRVRVLEGIEAFPSARVQAATWTVVKGETTRFPVPVEVLRRKRPGWQPSIETSLADVRRRAVVAPSVVERVAPEAPGSRWIVGPEPCVLAARALAGPSGYRGRAGVFTGGANAVYYLEPATGQATRSTGWFSNMTRGAKRAAPRVRVELETDLVYEVVRGRDLARWHARSEALLLCPHTRATRMRALPPEQLAERHPKAWSYLRRMRPVLDRRRGFTAWERSVREEAFYALQRIGDYTFAPYKVAWRYVADDFVVAVVGPDAQGRPRLPNDKVMFVGLEDPREAHFLCGLLSSDPVRWKVVSYAAKTQISASAIDALGLPRFAPDDPRHAALARASEDGHRAVARGDLDAAASSLDEINERTAALLGLDDAAMDAFRRELGRRLGSRSGAIP